MDDEFDSEEPHMESLDVIEGIASYLAFAGFSFTCASESWRM